MILTLHLTPEEERRLQGAQARGIDVPALLKSVIAGLPPLDTGPAKTQTPAERVTAFRAYVASRDPNTPVLSDEAISRESIYGERD